LSRAGLVELAGGLSGRDRQIVEAAVRLRLVSGKQLERLFFTEIEDAATRARIARRTLARLAECGLLGRLERRVGGVRAGAAGYVYFATSAGQRLVAYWQGQGLRRPRERYEPSRAFARHALGISESYVRLIEAQRARQVELLDFQAEPACWRAFTGPAGVCWLKPDAFVRLTVDPQSELHAFLEIDCATEGRTTLTRKARAYLTAWQAGIGSQVFPRVVWITTSQRRVQLLVEVCGALPAEAWKLFAVTTPERALEVLTGKGAGGGWRE
jgi:hypothetical protein